MSFNLFNLFLGQSLGDIFPVVDNTDFATCLDRTAIYDIGESIDQITFSQQGLLKETSVFKKGVSKTVS